MTGKKIRISENKLKQIVTECVKRSLLREDTDPGTDGAMHYQGSQRYQNSGKRMPYSSLSQKDWGYRDKIFNNDSWDGVNTHGAPKEVDIRSAVGKPLEAAINKIEWLMNKMQLTGKESGFLKEIHGKINEILTKVYDYTESSLMDRMDY